MSSSFVRSYLVRNEQLIRVAWLASFPGSTDQLFFARSEKRWSVEPGNEAIAWLYAKVRIKRMKKDSGITDRKCHYRIRSN